MIFIYLFDRFSIFCKYNNFLRNVLRSSLFEINNNNKIINYKYITYLYIY